MEQKNWDVTYRRGNCGGFVNGGVSGLRIGFGTSATNGSTRGYAHASVKGAGGGRCSGQDGGSGFGVGSSSGIGFGHTSNEYYGGYSSAIGVGSGGGG